MRGFISLVWLTLVAVIVIGFGYWFVHKDNSQKIVSPTITQTPVNTYQDKDYNFEFKYGSSFSVKEDSEERYFKRNNGDARKNFAGYVGYQPPKLLKALTAVSGKQTLDQAAFIIWIFDNPDNLDAQKWYTNFWYYPFQWGVFDYAGKQKIAPEMEASISGKLVNYTVVDYQQGKPKYIYLSLKDKMFLIRILTKDNTGEKILSTFKLTN